MKKKSEQNFYCKNCGYESIEWLGRCPVCNSWNSFAEVEITQTDSQIFTPGKIHLGQLKPITEIRISPESRIETGLKEFDRVVGGGIFPGASILVGGEPGVGKSTLMLELAGIIAKKTGKVLYISGEESLSQIKIRAERLNINHPELYLLAEVSLSNIIQKINELKPKLIIIDSIQTVYNEKLNAPSGSVSQVKESANFLIQLAKSLEIPLFIIGHVTKEGNLAGPRILEHMVDTVLYFEGEKKGEFRILRAVKNRFGSTNEIGVMEMTPQGLQDVSNVSEIFLKERTEGEPGSIVVSALEGTRPILVEIQALVSPSYLTMPRRTFSGIDFNRASIIIAVLEKKVGFKLSNHDIFLNVAGGLQLNEPAVDLGIALAIASAYKNKPIKENLIVIGEVGLTGEVRSVSNIEKRIQEAIKLGFKKFIIPVDSKIKEKEKTNLVFVKTLSEAIKAAISLE